MYFGITEKFFQKPCENNEIELISETFFFEFFQEKNTNLSLFFPETIVILDGLPLPLQ